jgi:hypothetical protein
MRKAKRPAPLSPRDGEFVLKYFLLRTAGRKQSWRKRDAPAAALAPAETDTAPR